MVIDLLSKRKIIMRKILKIVASVLVVGFVAIGVPLFLFDGIVSFLGSDALTGLLGLFALFPIIIGVLTYRESKLSNLVVSFSSKQYSDESYPVMIMKISQEGALPIVYVKGSLSSENPSKSIGVGDFYRFRRSALFSRGIWGFPQGKDFSYPIFNSSWIVPINNSQDTDEYTVLTLFYRHNGKLRDLWIRILPEKLKWDWGYRKIKVHIDPLSLYESETWHRDPHKDINHELVKKNINRILKQCELPILRDENNLKGHLLAELMLGGIIERDSDLIVRKNNNIGELSNAFRYDIVVHDNYSVWTIKDSKGRIEKGKENPHGRDVESSRQILPKKIED